jgi:hypothetical protein
MPYRGIYRVNAHTDARRRKKKRRRRRRRRWMSRRIFNVSRVYVLNTPPASSAAALSSL